MTLGSALAMGGFGSYVWSSYGITLLGLAWLAIVVRRRWRSQIERARRRALSNAQRRSPDGLRQP